MASTGKVRAARPFTERRLKRWPQVPTLKELGQDFVIESLVGLVAPKNMARVATRLHVAFKKAGPTRLPASSSSSTWSR